MSSNVMVGLNVNINNNGLIFSNISSTEMNILYGISISGIVINILTMIYLLIIAAYRMKSSCFLFHHCLICLTLSILALPYALSFSNYSIGCEYLGNIQVTCVTAQLLNMAAMVASEAYRFEDLIHQDSTKENSFHSEHLNRNNNNNNQMIYQLKESNKSTISCGCLSFGILIIWFSSIILHLGITMIGSNHKSYYAVGGQYCNFLITDTRGYVLTLMWIIITIFSLLITIRYIHKILNEVSLKRRTNQPLLSLTILGQYQGQSIASRDILMQHIEQRIKLNIILIGLFIIFWFPLFILTLAFIKLQINIQILRYLLLVAWSNSSISALTYFMLLSKCSHFCSLCFGKDRSSTYDSLTSYYNRIGDRFHDLGKWDQLNKTDQENPKKTIHLKQINESEDEHLNEYPRKLNQRNEKELHSNSLFIQEINENNHSSSSSSSSSSSLTTVTNHHFPNGLLLTSTH